MGRTNYTPNEIKAIIELLQYAYEHDSNSPKNNKEKNENRGHKK